MAKVAIADVSSTIIWVLHISFCLFVCLPVRFAYSLILCIITWSAASHVQLYLFDN